LWIIADKNRELGEAQSEIKSLKLSERAREKALEEVLLSFHIIQIELDVFVRLSILFLFG
jgi:Microtubule-associated protein 70